MKRLIFVAATMLQIFTLTAYATEDEVDMRLYRLDCGSIHVNPLNVFSDVEAYPNREIDLVDSCYLIKHGNDWMMWDTGLPENIAAHEGGVQNGPFHLWVDQSITNQLAKIGLKPEDINYVGISHGHFDHIGNVNLFKNAELIIQSEEFAFFDDAENARAHHMDPDLISFFLDGEGSKQVRQLNGDADIFGDGTVR